MVTWNIPQLPNGPLSGYRVYYQPSNRIITLTETTAAGYNTTFVPFPTQTVNIAGLKIFTHYSIFVEALGILDLRGDIGNGILQRTNATVTDFESVPTSSVTEEPTANSFVFDLPSRTITTGPLK